MESSTTWHSFLDFTKDEVKWQKRLSVNLSFGKNDGSHTDKNKFLSILYLEYSYLTSINLVPKL